MNITIHYPYLMLCIIIIIGNIIFSQNFNTEMFIYLLKNGANPHSVDKNNCTVLYMSTLTNKVEIVRALLKYDVKNDCMGEDNVTCLMTAAYSGSYDIVLELLKISIKIYIFFYLFIIIIRN